MGRDIDPNGEIVVTCGSTEAMMAAMMTVANPGDKVVIFSPFYENYSADTILSGAVPIYVPLTPPSFTFDPEVLEDAFRQHPKALILCNPSNPCGKVFTRAELELIADMAEDVFAIRKGEIAGPAKSDLGWHIMKVTDIKAGSKADKAEARRKIVETLKKERAYDEAYTVSAEIEDKIGGGATLEDIAGEMGVRILNVKGLGEDGKYAKAPAAHAEVLKSTEFVDTAFSYNVGEISQVTETDDGFVIVRVDQIADAHPIPMEKVKGEIEKMWEVNERSAIAQEIINDVMHDLENGDKIDEVGQRFGLTVKNTKPLLRSGSFEGLSQDLMIELFQEGLGKPKLISLGEEKIIAVADKVTDAGEKPSEAGIDGVKRRARIDLSQDAAASLVNSFGEDYDVRVKYRLIGLAD